MSNLKDVRQKGIPLQLDKERVLKFTLNSFAELEDMYGSVDQAMKSLEGGSMKAVRTLLWAGLIHEDPTLTPQTVGAMITMDDLETISASLITAMNLSMPEKDDKEEGNKEEDNKEVGNSNPAQ
jgi:hypothetical protein